MDYDVKFNGVTVGTLTVETEGLMTVFEARTRRLEGIQRLWAAGEDKSVCLGVLMPESDGMHLHREKSRRDMAELPAKILCVSASPERPAPLRPPKPENAKMPPENELSWQPSAMGTLTAIHEGVICTAIPAMLRRKIPGVRLETIGGREYIIFRRSY